MENWRHYQKREELLDDSVYITEVLGIKIPLNESHPYSLGLMEEIYKEQMLFEGFLDSAKKYVANKTAPLRDLVWIIYKAATDKGGHLLGSFTSSLVSNIIKPMQDSLSAMLSKIKLPEVYNWIKENVIDPAKATPGIRGLINFAGLAVFLRLGYQKLKGIVDVTTDAAGGAIGLDDLKEKVQEWLTNTFQEPWEKVKAIGAKLLDIDSWIETLGPLVGGPIVIAKMLAPATKGFAGRGDHDQEFVAGKEACQVARRCSPTQPTQVGQKAGSRAGLISPEDCVQAKKDCQTYRKQGAEKFQENLKDENII